MAKKEEISIFGGAKTKAPSVAKKDDKEVVVVKGLEEKLLEFEFIKAQIKDLTAQEKTLNSEIKDIAKEKFVELYQSKRGNPNTFLIKDGEGCVMILPSDAYIKIGSEARANELMEAYGDDAVTVDEQFIFNNSVLQRNMKAIEKAIRDAKGVSDDDKRDLIDRIVTYSVAKGFIDKLYEYGDNMETVMNDIQPIISLKSCGGRMEDGGELDGDFMGNIYGDGESRVVSIEEVRDDGEFMDSYMIDESQAVSNAGEQESWFYNGKNYLITTWNERAVEHNDGDEEISVNDEYIGRVYTVWVGGSEVNDSLLTRSEAEDLANEYREDGYDDVVVVDNTYPISEGEYRKGGRVYEAYKRDRAYKSNQPHELAYRRKTRPKNPRYKKDTSFFADGGGVVKKGDVVRIITPNHTATGSMLVFDSWSEDKNYFSGKKYPNIYGDNRILKFYNAEFEIVSPQELSKYAKRRISGHISDREKGYATYADGGGVEDDGELYYTQDYFEYVDWSGDGNNDGYLYGINLLDDNGDVLDAEWFESDQERRNYVLENNLFEYKFKRGGKVARKARKSNWFTTYADGGGVGTKWSYYKSGDEYVLAKVEVDASGTVTGVGKEVRVGYFKRTSFNDVTKLIEELNKYPFENFAVSFYLTDWGMTQDKGLFKSVFNGYETEDDEDNRLNVFGLESPLANYIGKMKKYVKEYHIEENDFWNRDALPSYADGGAVKTVFTKDGVEVEKGTDKYKGHIFYHSDGVGYMCLGYFPNLDDCMYRNMETGTEVVGCMDGFYYNNPMMAHGGMKMDYSHGGMHGGNISTATLEAMVGRKLNGWNDDVVIYNGAKYQKLYLQPFYVIA